MLFYVFSIWTDPGGECSGHVLGHAEVISGTNIMFHCQEKRKES